jgi:putative hemolysin
MTGLFIALVLLLAASAFCSSAESAFFSLNPLDIRRVSQKHPRAGQRIHDVLALPTRLLSTILITNTIVNVAASAIGYLIAVRVVPAHAEPISIAVMTILILVFGEIGPKRVGLFYAERFAFWYSAVFPALIRLLAPVRILLEKTTASLDPFFRPHGVSLSQEEFESVVEIGREEGILDADEMAMIKAIIHLEDLKASNVMTPRVDTFGIDLAADPSTYLAAARKARVNYLLLFRQQVDSVEGFLDVRKFLLDPEHRVDAARLPPFFVPEGCRLNVLLNQFQKDHRRIAVVVDEYGGTAGIVTRGDILEEISGDIYDELSQPRPLIQPLGANRWLVEADISLEELNRMLDTDLEAEGADRLAGWITAQAGHVPQADEVIEAQGCRATVMQTLKLRVTLVQLEKLEAKG